LLEGTSPRIVPTANAGYASGGLIILNIQITNSVFVFSFLQRNLHITLQLVTLLRHDYYHCRSLSHSFLRCHRCSSLIFVRGRCHFAIFKCLFEPGSLLVTRRIGIVSMIQMFICTRCTREHVGTQYVHQANLFWFTTENCHTKFHFQQDAHPLSIQG